MTITPTASLAGGATVNTATTPWKWLSSSSSANLKCCLAISDGTGSLRLGAANTNRGTYSNSSPL